MIRTSSIRSQDDPLSIALRPPPTESDTDRQMRLQQEAEARRISEQIDEDLRIEREKLKRSKGDVKVTFIVYIRLMTDVVYAQSCCFWARPSQANRHCRNNSSSCTAQLRSRVSECPGELLYISTSSVLSKKS